MEGKDFKPKLVFRVFLGFTKEFGGWGKGKVDERNDGNVRKFG